MSQGRGGGILYNTVALGLFLSEIIFSLKWRFFREFSFFVFFLMGSFSFCFFTRKSGNQRKECSLVRGKTLDIKGPYTRKLFSYVFAYLFSKPMCHVSNVPSVSGVYCRGTILPHTPPPPSTQTTPLRSCI